MEGAEGQVDHKLANRNNTALEELVVLESDEGLAVEESVVVLLLVATSFEEVERQEQEHSMRQVVVQLHSTLAVVEVARLVILESVEDLAEQVEGVA